ncbi:MAG: J domain-containing protein [Myxococcales bacterium]|nr:J domain-containing protein [Myxococcales bacterium]
MSQDRKAAIEAFVERAHKVLNEVNYYQLLRISTDSDTGQVRAAYYKLAASLHPDVHGIDVDPTYRKKLTAVFSRVAEAYRVLSDSSLRARYDRELSEGKVRIGMGADINKKEHDISDAGALRFYKLGKAAIGDDDSKSALMNLRFALQKDPESQSIKDALEIAEKGKA